MLLAEYWKSPHAEKENPSVRCNALYKTPTNFNCNLTPAQAIEFARHLLEKAQLLLDNQIEDGAVQVWNVGARNEVLSLGLIEARKGPRRKKAREPEPAAVKPSPRAP